MRNHIYEITVSQDGKTQYVPAYTCGHCTNVVILRPNRTRERKRCFSCDRLICEMNEICNAHCTPLYSLAKDHFEGAGEFGKYVPAIMSGVSTIREAEEKGLIVP